MSLTMADKHYIRGLYEREGLSYKEISEKTGNCYRTVKKCVMDDEPWKEAERKERVPYYPMLGAWIPKIDEILETDKGVPRKQRHTAKAIHEKLTKEGMNCSYSSVKRYVRKRKEEMGRTAVVALPLQHRVGHAQADFGEVVYLDEENRRKKGYLLVISFPYSNRVFAQLLPSQNALCLFEGMRAIFAYIGRVPAVIRFDNMKTAVAKVGKGKERTLTESFQRFRMYYGFECEFCAPAAPESKGHVENMVGYVRRNTLAGIPTIKDMEAFNRELLGWCDTDAERPHYTRQELQSTLWQDEVPSMKALPEREFDPFETRMCKANNYGMIQIDKSHYGIGGKLQGRMIEARLRWNSVELYYEGKLITKYGRSYTPGEEQYDPVLLLDAWSQKPAAMEQTRHYEELPEAWRMYFESLPPTERRDAVGILKDLMNHPETSADACDSALLRAQAANRVDKDTICQFFWQEIQPAPSLTPMEKFREVMPSISGECGSQLSDYNKLLQGRFPNGTN